MYVRSVYVCVFASTLLLRTAPSLGWAKEVRRDLQRSSDSHTGFEPRAGQRGNLARSGWWPAYLEDRAGWLAVMFFLSQPPDAKEFIPEAQLGIRVGRKKQISRVCYVRFVLRYARVNYPGVYLT